MSRSTAPQPGTRDADTLVEDLVRQLIAKRLDEQRGVHLEGLLGQLARKLGHDVDTAKFLKSSPSLSHVFRREASIGAFIIAQVSVRPIVTAWQLERELCDALGLQRFEDFGLGPLLRNPLMQRYFQPPEGQVEPYAITPVEVMQGLATYRRHHRGRVEYDAFLRFLAEGRNRTPEQLCVRLLGLGDLLDRLRTMDRLEQRLSGEMEQKLHQHLLAELAHALEPSFPPEEHPLTDDDIVDVVRRFGRLCCELPRREGLQTLIREYNAHPEQFGRWFCPKALEQRWAMLEGRSKPVGMLNPIAPVQTPAAASPARLSMPPPPTAPPPPASAPTTLAARPVRPTSVAATRKRKRRSHRATHPEKSVLHPSLALEKNTTGWTIADQGGLLELQCLTEAPKKARPLPLLLQGRCGFTGGRAFVELVVRVCRAQISFGWASPNTHRTGSSAEHVLFTNRGDCLLDGQLLPRRVPTFGLGARVGCLLDFGADRVVFYLKGEEAAEGAGEPLRIPAWARAGVFPTLQVRGSPCELAWNLGGAPFQFLPPEAKPDSEEEGDDDDGDEDETEEGGTGGQAGQAANPSLQPTASTAKSSVAMELHEMGKRKLEEISEPESAKRMKADPCSCPCHSSLQIDDLVLCTCTCAKEPPALPPRPLSPTSCAAPPLAPSRPPPPACAYVETPAPSSRSATAATVPHQAVVMAPSQLAVHHPAPGTTVVMGSTPLTLLKMMFLLMRVYHCLGVTKTFKDLPDLHPQMQPTSMHPLAPDPKTLLEVFRDLIPSLVVSGEALPPAADPTLTLPEPVRPLGALLARLRAVEERLLERCLAPSFEAAAGCTFVAYAARHAPAVLASLPVPPTALRGTAVGAGPAAATAEATPRLSAELLAEQVQLVLQQVQSEAGQPLGRWALAHAVEQAVAASLRLARFAETGYDSLAAFAAQHPRLALALPAGAGPGAARDVELLVAYCGALMGELRVGVVEHVAIQHFGVRTFGELGLGPCRELLQHYRRQPLPRMQRLRADCAIAAPLCSPDAGSQQSKSHAEVGDLSVVDVEAVSSKGSSAFLGPIDADRAMAALLCTPCLVDFSGWTQWDAVFAPALGALADFVADRLRAAATWAAGARALRLLQCGPAAFVWVDAEPTERRLCDAVSTGAVWETAIQVVSLVVQGGGIANAPTHLLADAVRAGLQRLQATAPLAPFVLRVIRAIPAPVQTSAVVQRLLLEPLQRLHPTAAEELLAHCEAPQDFMALHRLGLTTGCPAWQAHLRAHLAADPRAGLAAPLPFLAATARDARAPAGHSHGHPRAEAEPRPAAAPAVEARAEEEARMEERRAAEVARQDSAPPNATEAQCRAVIAHIRTEEFGVGVELGAHGQQLMGKQVERLGRALQRLSLELYSTDTHFVLELIQNADDNAYPAGVPPTLCFLIDDTGVACINNEVGFAERNVRALCDIGRSTKPETAGYIGQKGIGFKSVFRITDTPIIHSAGFHFRFDASRGNIGYILPAWEEQPYHLPAAAMHQLPPEVQAVVQASPTRIVLPFKPTLQADGLRANFEEVHVSLLLFLNRLRQLVIADSDGRASKVMAREDLPNGEVQVTCNGESSRWLLVKRRLQPPPHVTRNNLTVHSTEVALAFPLTCDPDPSVPLPPQQVFAYLPLRSYGFKFLINADWMVPSSREDITQHCVWNEWLRDQLPEVYVAALHELQRLYGELDAVECAVHVLRFLPLDGEVLGWFRPVADAVVASVRQNASMVTTEGDWVLPALLVSCRDEQILDLVPGRLLQRLLRFHYLDDSLLSRLPPGVLSTLKITALHDGHLLDLVEQLLKLDSSDRDRRSTVEKEGWVPRWMLAVDKLAKQHGHPAPFAGAARHIPRMAALPLVPLEGGGRVEVRGRHVVFFPPPAGTPRYAFHRTMKTVQAAFLGDPHEEKGQDLRSILLRMGVRPYESATVLEHHVLPLLTGPREGLDPDLAVSCLVFVKSVLPHCRRSRALWDHARGRAAVLATNRGLLAPSPAAPVHFSTRYGNPFDLLTILPEPCLLSECYVTADTDVAGWRQFLEGLGVSDFLQATRVQRVVRRGESGWRPFPWAEVEDGSYHCEDWECGEFAAAAGRLVGHAAAVQCTVKKRAYAMLCGLLAAFDLLWAERYAGVLWLRCGLQPFDSGADRGLHQEPSTFLQQLRTVPWVPLEAQPTAKTFKTAVSTTVFSPTPELKALLGRHVPYCHTLVKSGGLADALGLTARPSVGLLLGLLERWAGGEGPQPTESPTFRISVAQLQAIYAFLLAHLADDRDRIAAALTSRPALFVPTAAAAADPPEADKEVEGVWLSAADVCLQDHSGVVDDFGPPRVLAKHYPSTAALEDLFAGVASPLAKQPSAAQYLEVVERIAARLSANRGGPLVVKVLHALSEGAPALLADIVPLVPRQARILPTTQGDWVSVASGCVLDDAPHLTRHFPHDGGPHGIYVLNVPLASGAAMLVRQLGVPVASAVIREEVVAAGEEEDSPLDALVAFAVPYAQRFLCTKHPVRYAALPHVPALLRALRCRAVSRLAMAWHLGDVKTAPAEQMAIWDKSTNTLYVQTSAVQQHALIFRELSRLFFDTPHEDLALALTMLAMLCSQGRDAEQFARDTERLRPLPAADRWPVPEAAARSKFAFPEAAPAAVPAPTFAPLAPPRPGKPPAERVPRGPQSWPPAKPGDDLPRQRPAPAPAGPGEGGPGGAGGPADDDAAGGQRRLRVDAAAAERLVRFTVGARATPAHGRPEKASDEDMAETADGTEGDGASSTTGGGPTRPRALAEDEAAEGAEAEGADDAAEGAGAGDAGGEEREPRPTGTGTGPPAKGGRGRGRGTGKGRGSAQRDGSAPDPRIRERAEYDPQRHALTIHDVSDDLRHGLPDLTAPNLDHMDQAFAMLIGQWGEQLVFSFLRRNHVANPAVEVKWINESEEQFLPYDLVVEEKGEDDVVRRVYVEVKSVREAKKRLFEVSQPQMQWAERHGTNYHMYCVQGAGQPGARLTHVIDPVAQWRQQKIGFCMVL